MSTFISLSVEADVSNGEIQQIGVSHIVDELYARRIFYITDHFAEHKKKNRYDCFVEFAEYIKGIRRENYGTHNQFVTWGCRDFILLTNELEKSRVDVDISTHSFIDCKTLYAFDRMVRGQGLKSKASLSNACAALGITPIGDCHDVGYDSTNTLALHSKLISNNMLLHEWKKQGEKL